MHGLCLYIRILQILVEHVYTNELHCRNHPQDNTKLKNLEAMSGPRRLYYDL